MPEEAPRVFISYSHDTEAHRDKVLAFADRLRDEGIGTELDRYEQFPPEGWNAHCARQIRRADRVLIVCTEIYRRRWEGEGEPGRGNGVRSEANLIRNYFYEDGSETRKFIPILFAEATEEHVPGELKGLGRYRVETADGYEQLYRLLTGQHDTPAPPIGPIRVLEPRARQSFGAASAAALPASPPLPDRPEANQRSEPDPHAQNYERVDMVSSEPEVLIDSPREGQERGVYAQVDFIERLYIQGQKARRIRHTESIHNCGK
jgi:SEFIR domain-containing protein